MRRLTLSAVAVASLVLAFVAGYVTAERRVPREVAERELGALMYYVPAIAYLRRGEVGNAKKLLYVATDAPLSLLSQGGANSLAPESQTILRDTLAHLNKAWSIDKPYATAEWDSVRKMPEWKEMRRRNDAFRESYATNP